MLPAEVCSEIFIRDAPPISFAALRSSRTLGPPLLFRPRLLVPAAIAVFHPPGFPRPLLVLAIHVVLAIGVPPLRVLPILFLPGILSLRIPTIYILILPVYILPILILPILTLPILCRALRVLPILILRLPLSIRPIGWPSLILTVFLPILLFIALPIVGVLVLRGHR